MIYTTKTNPVLQEVIYGGGWDKGDPWGSTMLSAFAIADHLQFGFSSTPADWEFTPGMGGPEQDCYQYQSIKLALEGLSYQEKEHALEHAGNVLLKYRGLLKSMGRDY
tara:strand:+ start:404 stop:727 length:324 start_codon:yes stop_codon:yes gene_type:complete